MGNYYSGINYYFYVWKNSYFMVMTRRLKGNIIAVCLAFLLSIAVYSGVTNYTNLATDIRGAAWVDATVLTDISVTVEGSDLIITTWKDIPDVQSISILLVYNTETVKRSSDTVESSYDRAVSEWEEWEATVIVTVWWKTLPAWTVLASLRVNWSPYDVVPADFVATFTDWSTASLVVTMP